MVNLLSGSSMRVRRSVVWFAIVSLLLLALLSLPSGARPQRVPPTVTVQGLSRTEAEFLYGHIRFLLRNMYWNALRHRDFKEAWFRIQDARHSEIQRLTKNPDGSASIVVVHSWPGKAPYTNDMRTTGNWPGKETK